MLDDLVVPFRAIVETTPDGVLVCDARGALVLVNAEAERMFGYAPGEMIGVSVDALVPDRVRPRHRGHVASYTAAPKLRLLGAAATELRGRRRDGSEFPCEISLSPFPTAEGMVVIGAVRDISERKELEAKLVAAMHAAEAASAAKSQFLSSMSHELRTPLAAILGFAQLLERDTKRPLDARQQERLGHVLRGGEHLLRLVDDVLDLSRIENGQLSLRLEPVDVGEALEQVARTLEPMAQRAGIALTVERGALPAAIADRTRLVQILMNFASNAIKYNRPGGSVALRGEVRGRRVRLAVADTGLGIAPEQRAKIFEPFQRAGQETGPIEGTGIGLTICRRLAQLMDAAIDFASELGAGSTFWIELTAAIAKPRGSGAPLDLAASPLARGPARYRVLYVEDNAAASAYMRDVLEELPAIALTTAPTAERGLELARAEPPHLVLMDINLPDLDGIEATARLPPGIPVVGLSAAALPSDTRRAYGPGFAHYLTKPVALVELVRVLDELLVGLAHDV